MTWPASAAARTARSVRPPARPTPARTPSDPAYPRLADLRPRKSAAAGLDAGDSANPWPQRPHGAVSLSEDAAGELPRDSRRSSSHGACRARWPPRASRAARGEPVDLSKRVQTLGRRVATSPARQGTPPLRRTSPRRSTQTPTDETQKRPTPRRVVVASPTSAYSSAVGHQHGRRNARARAETDRRSTPSSYLHVVLPHASVHARLTPREESQGRGGRENTGVGAYPRRRRAEDGENDDGRRRGGQEPQR